MGNVFEDKLRAQAKLLFGLVISPEVFSKRKLNVLETLKGL
jgi:hypothetical protein